MRISIRHLETFRAIAMHGSTLAAGGEMSKSQSAASMALAEMERRLGVMLFDRWGKRLSLNENGRLLLPKALAVLEQLSEIEEVFRSGATALRVGASTTVGTYVLPAIICEYRRASPKSTLQVNVANTRDVVQAVASFAVDIGLIEGVLHHPALSVTPWLHDELVIVAAPSHPLAGKRASSAMLSHAEWVLRESGSGTRELVEQFLLPHLGQFRVALELGNPEAIKQVVAGGIGLTCLPTRVAEDMLKSGMLVKIKTKLPPLWRRFSIIIHRQKYHSPGMKQFIAICGASESMDRRTNAARQKKKWKK